MLSPPGMIRPSHWARCSGVRTSINAHFTIVVDAICVEAWCRSTRCSWNAPCSARTPTVILVVICDSYHMNHSNRLFSVISHRIFLGLSHLELSYGLRKVNSVPFSFMTSHQSSKNPVHASRLLPLLLRLQASSSSPSICYIARSNKPRYPSPIPQQKQGASSGLPRTVCRAHLEERSFAPSQSRGFLALLRNSECTAPTCGYESMLELPIDMSMGFSFEISTPVCRLCFLPAIKSMSVLAFAYFCSI